MQSFSWFYMKMSVLESALLKKIYLLLFVLRFLTFPARVFLIVFSLFCTFVYYCTLAWYTYAYVCRCAYTCMYLHLYLFWLKRVCYLVLTCQRLCICFGADYESLLLLCAARWYASCGSGCLCLWSYHRGDVAGKFRWLSMAHSYCWDIYVVRGFISGW